MSVMGCFMIHVAVLVACKGMWVPFKVSCVALFFSSLFKVSFAGPYGSLFSSRLALVTVTFCKKVTKETLFGVSLWGYEYLS